MKFLLSQCLPCVSPVFNSSGIEFSFFQQCRFHRPFLPSDCRDRSRSQEQFSNTSGTVISLFCFLSRFKAERVCFTYPKLFEILSLSPRHLCLTGQMIGTRVQTLHSKGCTFYPTLEKDFRCRQPVTPAGPKMMTSSTLCISFC